MQHGENHNLVPHGVKSIDDNVGILDWLACVGDKTWTSHLDESVDLQE